MINTSSLIGGSQDQPIWVSGATYAIGQQVVSPASYKVYTRKTSGAGTTDPSLDSTNWTSQIKNATNLIARASNAIAITRSSGLLGLTYASVTSTTAGVLKTVFSYTNGGGIMPQFTISTQDATSRTLRLKVTIDGVVVFDATTSAINATLNGYCLAGTVTGSGSFIHPPITWSNSILIEAASSLTEANPFGVEYVYNGVA